MEFFIIGMLMIVIGFIIGVAKNTKIDDKICPTILFLLLAGLLIEQMIIRFMGTSGTELFGDSILNFWILEDVPFEIIWVCFALLYVLAMIYYGYIKGSVENKLLSPFRAYSKR